MFDEQMAAQKLHFAAIPRGYTSDALEMPSNCIVEIYELLWRWGHRVEHRDFAKSVGFTIPDTVVFVKGKPYAWYFISKKDGALLRKSANGLSLGAVEKKFCREKAEGELPIVATWMPIASQFPEARCHSQSAKFLSQHSCRDFLSNLRQSHSGILQAFVEPHGVSNFLVRTVHYKNQTSLLVRTNRAILNGGRGDFFTRCATFEGWHGLSSSCGRYRSHKHRHMQEVILKVGQALNERTEQEHVRQMLFLDESQHVALHFKVNKDHALHFIYASIITEDEVIVQTWPQLLMHDDAMTGELPWAALLPGGTARKSGPGAPSFVQRGIEEKQRDDESYSADGFLDSATNSQDSRRDYAPDPVQGSSAWHGNFDQQGEPETPQSKSRTSPRELVEKCKGLPRIRQQRQRPQSGGLRAVDPHILPRLSYGFPSIPPVPFQIVEAGRDCPHLRCPQGPLKRPLIAPVSARNPGPRSCPPEETRAMTPRSDAFYPD